MYCAETKAQIENLIKNRIKECNDTFDKYIALNPKDGVRKRVHEILMIEYDAILKDIKNLWVPNSFESDFIRRIEEAKRYVYGDLEINRDEEGDWYARDYREELGGSFEIKQNDYSIIPILTDREEIEDHINVQKCCEYCNVYYVG